MSIPIPQMRKELLKRYKSDSFRLKLEKMKDDQVYAFYTRLQRGGVFK